MGMHQHHQLKIKLPEDAPFTPAQRAWLDEFLAKALAEVKPLSVSAIAAPVTVLYGTQTGNAEGLAKKLQKTLKKHHFEVSIADMANYEYDKLAKEQNLLVIVSTYGDGDPPDNAIEFHNWVMGESAPKLEGLNYSVLALGDSEYPDFCQCGIEFDKRLAELGATPIRERMDVDVDPDEPYAQWSAEVLAALSPTAVTHDQNEEEEVSVGYSKKRPFPSTVLHNRNLNGPGAKQTHHLEFLIEDSGLEYEVGDALAVVPRNNPRVVDEIISNLPFKAENVPGKDGREIPLRDALMGHYDIGALSKLVVKKWQAYSGSPFLRSLVESDDAQAYKDFCWGRELVDLVIDHPADFSDAEEFVSVLKKLQPRLYSIASSPNAHPGEVHLCVGVVRYETHGRQRGGVCSTFMSDRIDSETRPLVFVHQNKNFRLPEDASTPVIMVGPGTGIAPFRAFLEQLRINKTKSKNWLFFGNPHSATDYLYKEEIENFFADGTLERLDLAWSRDQTDKVYVQHLMIQQGAELWRWLEEGAAFYVCGDASRMAKDVDAALHQLIIDHGKKSDDEAKDYVIAMKKAKRYQRDVY